MRMKLLGLVAVLPLALGGCVVRTAANVATMPVRAGAKVVDWTTTSQDEADRNRGRKMRKDEARQRKEQAREERERRKDQQRYERENRPNA